VQKWFVGVTDCAGPGAANRTYDILLAAFNKAEQWGLRPEGSNPCNRQSSSVRPFDASHMIACQDGFA